MISTLCGGGAIPSSNRKACIVVRYESSIFRGFPLEARSPQNMTNRAIDPARFRSTINQPVSIGDSPSSIV